MRLYPGIHQAALLEVARRLLPAGLSIVGKASLHQDRSLLHLRCSGQASAEAVEEARRRFEEETGWEMEIVL